MDTLKQLKTELDTEYQTTKRFLEIFPDDKNDYKPHPKSMKMMHLATYYGGFWLARIYAKFLRT